MERAGRHTIRPRLIDQSEIMRIIARVSPVRAGARAMGSVTVGCDAYRRHQSPLHARGVGEADTAGFDVAANPPQARYLAWALVPNATLIGDAVAKGSGPRLVAQWDELARTVPWSTLPAAFGAAHAFRPNGAAEAHHRTKAASGGFDIVPVTRAVELRGMLLAASKPGGDCVDLDL